MKVLFWILIWTAGACLIAYLNCKFWKICPDREDNEAEVNKAKVKPLFPPYKVPFWHEAKYWLSIASVIAFVVGLFYVKDIIHFLKSIL